MNKLREFKSRVRFRWHAFIAAFIYATPVLLQQLQIIDIKPILSRYIGADIATVVVGLIPFYIAMLKPMFDLEKKHDDR